MSTSLSLNRISIIDGKHGKKNRLDLESAASSFKGLSGTNDAESIKKKKYSNCFSTCMTDTVAEQIKGEQNNARALVIHIFCTAFSPVLRLSVIGRRPCRPLTSHRRRASWQTSASSTHIASLLRAAEGALEEASLLLLLLLFFSLRSCCF